MTRQPWQKCGVEPKLGDVLADPIVLSLMKADRVTPGEVLKVSARILDRPAARECEDTGVPA